MELPESQELKTWHNEIVRDRNQMHSDFVDVVNAVEPDHPYLDDPYPITENDVAFSYCQSSSSYRAKCGPRSRYNVASFSTDRKTVGLMSDGRYHCLLVHEVTHITEGSHTKGGSHNPTFWRTMADNAVKLAQSDELDIEPEVFFAHCRDNPNRSMTDKRMRTVEEQQQEVENRILQQLDGNVDKENGVVSVVEGLEVGDEVMIPGHRKRPFTVTSDPSDRDVKCLETPRGGFYTIDYDGSESRLWYNDEESEGTVDEVEIV